MIEIPSNCPCCDSKLERVKDQLFCRSADCGEVATKKIVNFCKKMKVKGLAEQSIKKLGFTKVVQIYQVSENELTDILGKNGSKIYLEIQKSKSTTLADLIGSLSIPLVGRTTAKKIEGTSLTSFSYNKLPDKAKSNLIKWIDSDEWEDLTKITFNFLTPSCPDVEATKGLLVITGKFAGFTQATLKQHAEALGYAVASSVTRKTTLLLADKVGSSKYTKADALGIKIINTIEEL